MSVFNSDGNESVQNAFEALVGEGKKFSDPEALAKGKLEADNYIEQLKAQLAEVEAKVRGEENLEQMLAKIAEKQTPTKSDPVVEAHQPAKPAMTDDDLAAKVRAMLEDKDRQTVITNNVNEVANRLIDVYGSETAANEYVRKRAQELGVSVEFLQDVAAKSPKAFYETVRVEAPSTSAGPTKGDANPQALQKHSPGVKPNTYRWYQELRKDNPAMYNKLQLQMHNDALKNPDAFFER